MRHRKSFNHLSRKKGHRKAMLANMASSLIIHKRIKTTTAKAKALRMFVEPLITKSKNDSTQARRVVFTHLQNKEAVSELFREVSPKIIDRPGGYTRILKTGFRLGDNADMCIIELVDYNKNLLAAKSEAAEKTGKRRRRGSKKKAVEEGQIADKAVAAAEETETEAEIKEIKPEEEGIPEDLQQPSSEEKAEEEQEVKDENIEKETAEEIADEIKESKHEKPDVAEEKAEEEQEVKDEKQEEKAEEEQEVKDEKAETKEEGTEVKHEKENGTEVKDKKPEGKEEGKEEEK